MQIFFKIIVNVVQQNYDETLLLWTKDCNRQLYGVDLASQSPASRRITFSVQKWSWLKTTWKNSENSFRQNIVNFKQTG